MAAEARKGQFSGWLQKKKSGTAVVRVRQYNKRYFTMDFDTGVLSYSSSEGSKKASAEIPFADILDVRLLGGEQVLTDTASESSRQSGRVSLMKRMSSFGRKGEDEQEINGLTVLLRPAKQMELMCTSPSEALQWFEAFRTAIDSRSGDGACEAIAGARSGGSSDSDSEQSPSRRPSAPAEGGGGYPSQSAAKALPRAPVPAASGDGEPSGAVEPPKPATRGFLDFATIEEEPARGAPGKGKEDQEATEISTTGLMTLQAADFGFGAEDEDKSSSSSAASRDAASPGASPKGGGGATGSRSVGASPAAPSPGASSGRRGGGASESSPPGRGSGSAGDYKDRHQGLTLQERLANLEFSDDEEDDDDPLGLKQAGKG